MPEEGSSSTKNLLANAVFSALVVNSAYVKATLITRDASVRDAVSSVSAAVGANLSVAGDSETIRKCWRSSDLLLVGADLASLVVGLGLAERGDVHLVGEEASELLAWSVPLSAPALELPAQTGFLSSLLSGPANLSESDSLTIQVFGGSGGVGASTLAAGMAQRSAALQARTALVELDEFGGGIDLTFGAEKQPGWRWGELSSATGYVRDIGDQLPSIDGVDLVSMGRSDVGLPSTQAVRAVTRSLQRSHEMVILDSGLAEDSPVDANLNLIVVAADVKAVLAARARIKARSLQDADLVVRKSPVWSLDPQLVGETLGMPVCAVVPTDARMAAAAARGGAPGGSGRGAFVKACDKILNELVFSSAGGTNG